MNTRRSFLKKSVAAAGALAFPVIIPGTALGLNGRPAASERITLGAIGFGTIAYTTVPSFLTDERVQIVAVADPVKEMGNYGYSAEKMGGREVGKALVEKTYSEQKPGGDYKGCAVFEDFREMLEKADIDAVNVSTPDHWHAYAAIHCARKGKHIYGQKPLALTIGEGRRMVNEVAKADVTWQTGSQQRSDLYFRMAAEFVRNGRIGKIQEVRVGLPSGHTNWSKMADRKAPEPVPAGLNWELWQGPAPAREFRPALLQLNWRHNYDYSGGMITDWGAHHIDIVHWALDKDSSGPVSIDNIRGEMPKADDVYNVATSFHFEATYADGVRMIVDNTFPEGIEFIGDGGRKLFVKRGQLTFTPQELRAQQIKEGEIRLYESKGHERNFIDHIYDGKPTVCPVEVSHRAISVAHLANIALRLGKSALKWDPLTESSVDEEVNKMLTRPMRNGFEI